MASITDYETIVLPKPKNFVEIMVEELSGAQKERPSDLNAPAETSLFQSTAPDIRTLIQLLARLEPHRAAALKRTLTRINLIAQEGVILMMPMDLVIR